MSSPLDNKRDELAAWESQQAALNNAIEAVSDLDLYLTIADRFQ
jgi:hypothetical protein